MKQAVLSPEDAVPPAYVSDPVDLAKWALGQAAKKLSQQGQSSDCKLQSHPKEGSHVRNIMFGWEHPADPAELYEGHEARFDQGKFQHVRPKPTVFATRSWFLFEALHNQVLSHKERQSFGRGPSELEARLQESPSWGKWAPGFVTLVIRAWVQWGREQGLWQEVGVRRLLLAKLTEGEMQRKHADNDHAPFRKGCPICIQS